MKKPTYIYQVVMFKDYYKLFQLMRGKAILWQVVQIPGFEMFWDIGALIKQLNHIRDWKCIAKERHCKWKYETWEKHMMARREVKPSTTVS